MTAATRTLALESTTSLTAGRMMCGLAATDIGWL